MRPSIMALVSQHYLAVGGRGVSLRAAGLGEERKQVALPAHRDGRARRSEQQVEDNGQPHTGPAGYSCKRQGDQYGDNQTGDKSQRRRGQPGRGDVAGCVDRALYERPGCVWRGDSANDDSNQRAGETEGNVGGEVNGIAYGDAKGAIHPIPTG